MNLGGTIHITKTGCLVLIGSVIILTIYFLPIQRSHRRADDVNLKQLLSVAIQAAENGGKEVVDLLNNIQISSKGKTKEGANDSVTTADFNSHCVMMHNIKHYFSLVNVVSEEEVACGFKAESYHDLPQIDLNDIYVPLKDVMVWIDPLDATQEYTEKLTDYVTTMVCVAVNGKPIIGVIHKPFSKKSFWALVGHGFSSNIDPRKSHREKLQFIVSRSHMGTVREKIHTLFKDDDCEITSAGGAGYKVLEVVNGNADVYLHVTAIKKWDVCAGNAILNAVGGKMTTLHGTNIDYSDMNNPLNEDGIVATALQSLNVDFS